ncbi:tRNA (adenine(58)-N(1))-methyltransferase non-catalytic subunit TRM6-like [Hydractinia symbiolongicarpus]|uniref:tRNA (adenine(58)-N(1))-methyltransferase non-catalytic subunit TRM6-like n=1 Tax=Hydractinia symbiolongicarpus TaxID=13093 RepID=UPI00254AF23C|nr:tRNA (adenine(58)-N(1))-methyltransferase non-catalytic subunit TRM6-like [Hydractinia symbiolongicarpus]
MSSVIEAGKGVILRKGKNLKYVCVSDKKVEKMEKFLFSCKDMIGKPYGTAFKVIDKKSLEVIDPVLVEEHAEEYENNASINHDEITQDNRSIVDNPESQKLSKDEIMSLRDTGKTGEEIVQTLVDNSATFKDRTEFSKAKYIKKKKKKYLAQFVALRPCARLLAELYFFKNPNKIMDLRTDSLAQVLTWSNVQANSNVLLMETCQGFVAGAVMERLGAGGSMVQIYQGSFPVRIILEQFNFSVSERREKCCCFPMEKIACLEELFATSQDDGELLEYILGKNSITDKNDQTEKPTTDTTSTVEVSADTKMEPTVDMSVDTKMEPTVDMSVDTKMEPTVDMRVDKTEQTGDLSADVCMSVDTKTEPNPTEKEYEKSGTEPISNAHVKNSNLKRKHAEDGEINENKYTNRVAFISKEERATECLRALSHLRSKNFDCLIIVAKYHPKSLLLALLEFLPIAMPFVVYFTHQEPLAECYIALRDRKIAVNLELTETWLRNIQVLPKRTHPEIVMSATGGYILRGIKVDSTS